MLLSIMTEPREYVAGKLDVHLQCWHCSRSEDYLQALRTPMVQRWVTQPRLEKWTAQIIDARTTAIVPEVYVD